MMEFICVTKGCRSLWSAALGLANLMFLLSLVFLFIIKLRFPENKSIKNVIANLMLGEQLLGGGIFIYLAEGQIYESELRKEYILKLLIFA